MSPTAPFVLVTAFSNDVFGGNPAAVVFLGDRVLPAATLQKIAQNFNQPITSFLSSPSISDDGKIARFGIRWFHPVKEVPICGHGSLAAAKAIFTSPELVPETVETIELQTPSNGVITAKKEGSWLGMQWTPTFPEAVSVEEKTKIDGLLAKALGRNEIVTKFIGKGGKGYEHCVLIELDAEEDLGGLKVNIDELGGSGYAVNILTTASKEPEQAIFVSRMFAPGVVGEDHVCGSAHCLLGPYWARKRGLVGQEMKAKQVSSRGGDLRVTWDEDKNMLKLLGELTIIGKGDLFI